MLKRQHACAAITVLFACGLASCGDSHADSDAHLASAGATAPAPDAGFGLTVPERVVSAPTQPPPVIEGPNTVTSCERGGQRFKIGERHVDRAACASLRCTHHGWNSSHGFCDEGTACNGGPCSECALGSQRFPVGASLPCSDGCNECTCTGRGQWLQSLVACDGPPAIERCDGPPDGDQTRLLYLAGSNDEVLSLRAEFPLGGCAFASVKACYNDTSDGTPRARIWLAPQAPFAACTVPFVAEAVVSLIPLRELVPPDREHGTVALEIGPETLAYEF